jgi:DNA-binding CsgD family transcriptional regulator
LRSVLAPEAASRTGEQHDGLLSDREREVLALVAAGMSDQEIADQLVLSYHTVHRHVANIRHKLGSASRAAAVAEAVRLGLL